MAAMDTAGLRDRIPAVVGVLVRRGADFASAEDAVQSALVRALDVWPRDPPRDQLAWLVTAAWRAFIDIVRSDTARVAREARFAAEPEPGDIPSSDDTVQLYFLCAHPSRSATSAAALTLRAVAGLTTRQIADAYLVPEATMAQRISRAKQRIADVPLDRPGDVRTVLSVLYLVFTEGYSGAVDLAAEAIRVTRQLARMTTEPEVQGLLALMLLHHARRDARTTRSGALVPLAEQDRGAWDRAMIAEGTGILQNALAARRLGAYQAQAAIAALHADASRAAETDWTQIVEWYDELMAIAPSDIVRLNRAVAVGEAEGASAGLDALAMVSPTVPRFVAVSAYLHERAGERSLAAEEYTEAARVATSEAERDHLGRQAARLRRREP